MKKIFFFNQIVLIFTAAMFFFCGGCGKPVITNIGSHGKAIVCFGDSITSGEGVRPEEAYPGILAKMVSMPVINAGVSGDTTEGGLQRLESDVLNKNPYLVIVELGGNDFLHQMPLSEATERIRQITSRIQSRGAIVAIADVSCGLLMENYRRNYQQVARETGSIFIPSLMCGIITNSDMRSDTVHPNKEGHMIIAQRIYSAIKNYLPDGGAEE